MAHLIQTIKRLVEVAEADVEAYLAAGYTTPSDEELTAHKAADVYGGTQGFPAAQPVPTTVVTTDGPPDAPELTVTSQLKTGGTIPAGVTPAPTPEEPAKS